jgi:hypothetical protein
VITDSHFAGFCNLTLLQVDGTAGNVGTRGILIESCRIDGRINFWRETWLEAGGRPPDLKPWEHGAAVVGPVTIRKCVIGGGCDLTFLKTQGPVVIEGNTIGGDLLMSSLATLDIARLDDEDRKRLREELKAEGAESPSFRMIAPSLSLRMTTVEKDLDLTGLRLFPNSNAPARVDARNLVVKGVLRTYGKFEAHTARTIVPAGFDIADVQVGHWQIGEPLEDNEASAADYRTLLSCAPHQRSTYRLFEQYLHDRGHEDKGDEIHRAMWERESYRAPRIGKALSILLWPFSKAVEVLSPLWKHVVWPHLLRYGTDPLRLLGVIFFLMLISLPVYLHSGNIEASSSYLAMDASRDGGTVRLGGSPAKWDIRDAVAILFRYHVPLVPVEFREEWEPRDEPGVVYSLGPLHTCSHWLSPEDFALIMTVLNVPMWPLVLAFALRRALRQ